MTITILNYDSGNLGSIANAITQMGWPCTIESNPTALANAKILILPGQGAIASAMSAIKSKGLAPIIKDHIAQKKPLLGICLGMQLLMTHSEEDGGCDGLGIFEGTVKKFDPNLGIRIPHMGWNTLDIRHDPNHYFKGLTNPYFYFAHSYYIPTLPSDMICATTTYGVPFVSVIQTPSLLAIQSHPEKSGTAGLTVLKNFLTKWSTP